MEQELHYEKFGSGRKEKRLNNKRERNQTKQYLKHIEEIYPCGVIIF